MKDKLKIGIIVGIVIVVLIGAVLIIINVNSDKNTENTRTNRLNVIERTPISTTRKMSKYVDIINGDYYMEAKTVDENGNEVLTEYAILGDKMIIHDENTVATILVTSEASYYILHNQGLIIKYPIDASGQQNISGIQRGYTQELFARNFRGTGTEDINEVEYYYEEYSDNSEDSNKIRYYFDEDDSLKYIKIITSDSSNQELVEILELHSDVDETLFELPQGYEEINYEDLLKAQQNEEQ